MKVGHLIAVGVVTLGLIIAAAFISKAEGTQKHKFHMQLENKNVNGCTSCHSKGK